MLVLLFSIIIFFSNIFEIIGAGEYAPIPPVLGPLSFS